jgi:hypothetical protein
MEQRIEFALKAMRTLNFRSVQNRPVCVARRRRRFGVKPARSSTRDYPSIFALTPSFEMLHPFALLQPGRNLGFFVRAIRRQQLADRLPDHLVGRIPKDSLRSLVPAHDRAVIFADDGVIRRIDDRLVQQISRDKGRFWAHGLSFNRMAS